MNTAEVPKRDLQPAALDRPRMDVDVACVGFGPAMGGFLTTLSRSLLKPDGTAAFESGMAPGMPLQVVCYERADDLGFGGSGGTTAARALRASSPNLETGGIPMGTPTTEERFFFLLDPIGRSRRY